jgi:thioredoxin reductase (NADPH)
MRGALPIIFLVSSEASVLKALHADLERRFGNDTRIIAGGPSSGLEQLTELAGALEPVALLIADQRMDEMTGVDFLARRHTRCTRWQSGSCSSSATTPPRTRSFRR